MVLPPSHPNMGEDRTLGAVEQVDRVDVAFPFVKR